MNSISIHNNLFSSKALQVLLITIVLISFSNYGAILTQKTDDLITQRRFQDDLNNTYNGEDFTYIEKTPKVEESNSSAPDLSWLNSISGLLKIIPIVVILIAVFLIARALINNEGSWIVGKSTNKAIEKLELIDEEIIQNSNLEELLNTAIHQKNYRLAIRYQYLITLKKLSENHFISLDKDKTNSDYLLEIQTPQHQKEFSYLAYIYDYVWYGQFNITASDFTDLQQSFIHYNKTI